MRAKCLPLFIVLVILFASPALSIDLTVDTEIPDYILDDHIRISGTTNDPVGPLVITSDEDFSRGDATNVTVEDGSLVFDPHLDIEMKNGGEPVFEGGVAGSWDTHLWDNYYILQQDGLYYLYYTGSRTTSLRDPRHIGLATSTDGVNWTRHPDNPVLRSREEAYDFTNIMAPVVTVLDGQWHMWYAGNHGNNGSHPQQDIDICYATSDDGMNWTKHLDNPVIPNGDAEWNDIEIRPVDIHVNEIQGWFTLKYRGMGTTNRNRPYLASAFSMNGVDWTPESTNPLHLGDTGAWHNGELHYGTLEETGGIYRMWTFGRMDDWGISWITSLDGASWEERGEPFLEATADTIYSKYIWFPRVLRDDEGYLIYALCLDDNDVQTLGLFRATISFIRGQYLLDTIDLTIETTIESIDMMAEWSSPGGDVRLWVRWTDTLGEWSDWMDIRYPEVAMNQSARMLEVRFTFVSSSDISWVRIDELVIDFVTVDAIDIRVDGGEWQATGITFREWYRDIALHEGDYDIEVRMTESTGRSVVKQIPVKVDLLPPMGNITLEGGKARTESTTLSVALEANDTHGVPSMQVSFDPTFDNSSWMEFDPKVEVKFKGDEGEVTVYARFKDGAGRVSDVVSDTIVFEELAPAVSLTSWIIVIIIVMVVAIVSIWVRRNSK